MAAFVAGARSLDRGIGAVLDALDSHGHRANTLVICTTDHGIAFPGAKTTLYEPGLRIPFVVRGPGVTRAGGVCQAMINLADLTPTILELTGTNFEPESFDGQPLRNIYETPAAPRPAPRKFEQTSHKRVDYDDDTDPKVFERLRKWYPLGRVAEPIDIARAAAFFASDVAAYISGATLVVDGGLTAGNAVFTRELIVSKS